MMFEGREGNFPAFFVDAPGPGGHNVLVPTVVLGGPPTDLEKTHDPGF